MKKMLSLSILIIIICFSDSSYAQINFEPIKVDYFGIKRINNNIFILGNKGVLLKSDINLTKIIKYKIFNTGKIIDIFNLNSAYYIFNANNQVAILDNFDKKWIIKNIDCKFILSVIQVGDEFLIRSKEKILLIDKDLNLIYQYDLYSPDLNQINMISKFKYDYSMSYYQNKLIVETDSLKLLIFDKKLQLLDSVRINIKNIDSTKEYLSGYRLMIDSDGLYVTAYLWDLVLKNSSTYIFKTNNLKDFNIFEIYNKLTQTNIINNNFYYTSIYDNKFIDTNLVSFINQDYLFNYVYFNTLFNDFYIVNNYIYLIGDGGIIEKVDLQDTTINVISEQYWIDETSCPYVINDSAILFFSGFNERTHSALYPYFYITNNFSVYNSTLRKDIPSFNDSLILSRFFAFDFDKTNNFFYLIGKYDYRQNPAYAKFYSSDTLKSLKFIVTNNSKIRNLALEINPISLSIAANANFISPTLLKLDTLHYFVNNSNFYPLTQKDYTSFTILNSENYPIDNYVDSSYVMDFVYLKSLDNFLVHCANTIDSGRSEIKYTENHGATWNYVYKYATNDTLLGKYHIKLNNNEYLLLFHYDGEYSNTKMYFDAVDLSSYTWKRLRQWDLTKENIYFTQPGIFSDGKELNFAIGDTLYYIKDLYNMQSWKYRVLADSGRMFDPIVKYGDKFISGFANQYGNFGMCLISFSDTTLLRVKDYEIEKRNYLYSMQPYPQPATNRVQAEIYWDKALDINQADIKVYNIYGEEINSKDKIEVVPESDWYGKLIWNCEGNEAGVYIITINYGTEKKAIKVIKN